MAQSHTITNVLAGLGRMAISPVREMGRVAIFFFRGVTHLFSFPLQADKIIDQVYFIGMKSVFVICLTGAFTGMVLGLQGYYTLVKFGSEGVLGAVVALTLIREMGPVLTAIMVVGRAGSAMAAIEAYGITGEQPAYDRGNGCLRSHPYVNCFLL